MREILFRGKRIDNGEWIEGFYCQTADESNGGAKVKHVIVVPTFLVQKGFLMYEVDPSTVGQYTGLTDKNGKKIFEGDIVKYPRYGDNRVEYVTYSCEDTAYQFSNGKTVCMNIGAWFNGFELEVIGNIHDNFELFDNPELLEDKL